jgi:spore maturation protein B
METGIQGLYRELSNWALPLIILAILTAGLVKKVKVYESFVEGAKDGFNVAVRIIPYLVAILCAIAAFRASGAMELLSRAISPITNLIGMPAETVPLALIRPLSGSGALGLMSDLITTHGPDSFIGKLASTMMGCTETTFYVLAVYFGSVGIKRIRYSLAAGLLADIAGIISAVFVCNLIFN